MVCVWGGIYQTNLILEGLFIWAQQNAEFRCDDTQNVLLISIRMVLFIRPCLSLSTFASFQV